MPGNCCTLLYIHCAIMYFSSIFTRDYSRTLIPLCAHNIDSQQQPSETDRRTTYKTPPMIHETDRRHDLQNTSWFMRLIDVTTYKTPHDSWDWSTSRPTKHLMIHETDRRHDLQNTFSWFMSAVPALQVPNGFALLLLLMDKIIQSWR